MQHIQIAIDGPSGAGKSTISKAIAARLGIVYVDTGALYRTVGYYARSQGISLPAIAAVVDKLSDIHVEVRYVDGVQNVFLNAGKTWDIKGADGMKIGIFTNLIWNPALAAVNFVGGFSFRM